MELFKTTRLTSAERRLIKKIAKLQLGAIADVLNDDLELDLTMYKIEHGIQGDQLNEKLRKTQILYQEIYNDPGKFIALDEYNHGLLRHILINHFQQDKHAEARQGIWRKLTIAYDTDYSLQ